MAKFTDAAGREWEIPELTLGAVERLRRDAGVDLDELMEAADGVTRVFTLPKRKIGQLLWVLCERQAQARGVSPGDFAELFTGRAIDRAVDALVGELLLFYPPRTAAGEEVVARLPEYLARMDAQIRSRVRDHLAAGSSGTATGSPESAESLTLPG